MPPLWPHHHPSIAYHDVTPGGITDYQGHPLPRPCVLEEERPWPAHLSGAGLRPLAEVGGDRGQALHRRVPVSHGLRLRGKQRAAVQCAHVVGHVQAQRTTQNFFFTNTKSKLWRTHILAHNSPQMRSAEEEAGYSVARCQNGHMLSMGVCTEECAQVAECPELYSELSNVTSGIQQLLHDPYEMYQKYLLSQEMQQAGASPADCHCFCGYAGLMSSDGDRSSGDRGSADVERKL